MPEGAIVVDARTNEQFDEAHIMGAISASAYDTGFATKVAKVVPADVEMIVVAASDGYELEAAELLASVGLSVRGFLEGGMTAWRSEERPVQRLEMIDPDALAERLAQGDGLVVLDVRDEDEFAEAHIPGSMHVPYGQLQQRFGELPADRTVATVCSGRQAQRARRLDPPARGLRRGDPRRSWRGRHLAPPRASGREGRLTTRRAFPEESAAGALHQGLQRTAPLWSHGQPGRDRDPGLRLAKGLSSLAQAAIDLLQGLTGDRADELIRAPSHDRIEGAKRGSQRRCRFAQHRIAGWAPLAVVQLPEPVDLDPGEHQLDPGP